MSDLFNASALGLLALLPLLNPPTTVALFLASTARPTDTDHDVKEKSWQPAHFLPAP